MIYEPFPHLKPRGPIYDLPPLPPKTKQKETTMEQTKLTLEHILACVKHAEYQRFGTLTFCVLTLQNGYKVTGESACLNETNFDARIGEKIARDNAIEKIWMLEGYLAKQQQYLATTDQEILQVIKENKALLKQDLS